MYYLRIYGEGDVLCEFEFETLDEAKAARDGISTSIEDEFGYAEEVE